MSEQKIRHDKLLPDKTAPCHRCGAHLPGGSDVVMVPVSWVQGRAGVDAGYFLFCISCPVPEEPGGVHKSALARAIDARPRPPGFVSATDEDRATAATS